MHWTVGNRGFKRPNSVAQCGGHAPQHKKRMVVLVGTCFSM